METQLTFDKPATPVKTCGRCRLEKPLSEFGKDAYRVSGLNHRCKTCVRDLSKIRYASPVVNPRSAAPKQCSRCGTTKPADEFYSEPKASDGLKSACQECERKRSRRYGRSEAGRAKSRQTYARLKDSPEFKAKAKIRQRLHMIANREKHNARNAVAYAKRRGRLVPQPCAVCGNPSAVAHHPDYAHRLAVRWLCPLHHGIAHRKYA